MASITDQLFSLKDENVDLKKRLTGKDDRTRKMIVKIEKLSKELSRERRGNGIKVPPEERETTSLLDELRF
jgi:hypothetical protein